MLSFEFFMCLNIYLVLAILFCLYISFVHLYCQKSVCNTRRNTLPGRKVGDTQESDFLRLPFV